MNHAARHIIRWFLGLLVLTGLTQPAAALRKHQPWDVTTRAEPDAQAGGWFINLGITGARAKILREAPNILEVTYVFEKTPAFGKLEVGDKIVGANGKLFTEAHKFGYGAINVITMQAKMAWALMQRCGLEVDAERFRATHNFVARGTNKIGYVWYKDGGKNNPSYADMGRTGASAIAHYLSPVGGEAYIDFAKLNASCIGNHPKTFPDTHGAPLLGMAWTGLGALPDPVMFRKLMDYNRWHFALSQCPDGTFYYQPNRDNNPQDFAANPRLCASAVTALILSAKHRRLQMTGAKLITNSE
jgi:hypothetical protein